MNEITHVTITDVDLNAGVFTRCEGITDDDASELISIWTSPNYALEIARALQSGEGRKLVVDPKMTGPVGHPEAASLPPFFMAFKDSVTPETPGPPSLLSETEMKQILTAKNDLVTCTVNAARLELQLEVTRKLATNDVMYSASAWREMQAKAAEAGAALTYAVMKVLKEKGEESWDSLLRLL